MTQAYLQMGAALAGVLGLIVLIGQFLKKKQGNQGMLKLSAYQALGPKKGIAAVRVGKQTLLIGVTANDLKLLTTIEGDLEEPVPAVTGHEQIGEKLKELRSIKDRLYAAQ